MEGDMPAVDAFEYNMNSFMSHKMLLAGNLISSLCGLFIAITFLQSGLNKLADYSGNKSYFNAVFEKTFMRSMTGFLLPVVMLLELISGIGCIIGIVVMWGWWNPYLLGYSLALSAFALLCLLSGQRIAKDYAGAASLASYFIVAILGLFGFAIAW